MEERRIQELSERMNKCLAVMLNAAMTKVLESTVHHECKEHKSKTACIDLKNIKKELIPSEKLIDKYCGEDFKQAQEEVGEEVMEAAGFI